MRVSKIELSIHNRSAKQDGLNASFHNSIIIKQTGAEISDVHGFSGIPVSIKNLRWVQNKKIELHGMAIHIFDFF